MVEPYELIRSVEWVWAAWLLSLLAMVWGWTAWWRRVDFKQLRLRVLHRRDEGASYMAGYILTMPIYLIVVCLAVETTLLLTTKMGTIYAAFAAARSAIVWIPNDNTKVEEKARKAAAQAMVPFGGQDTTLSTIGGLGQTGNALKYYLVYQNYFPSGPVVPQYLGIKYANAYAGTTVTLTPRNPTAFNTVIKATVTHKTPITIPGMAALLGQWSLFGGYTYQIQSDASLQLEGDKFQRDYNQKRTGLGIGYVSQ